MTAEKKKRIAIFASGAGSNAEKIIEYFRGRADVEVALVVCNKPGAGVTLVAQKNNIPCIIISKKDFFETGCVSLMKEQDILLIVLAGFLWKIPEILIRNFPGRIINIHPALLPAYGGKGMYGMAVHTAVIDAEEKCSGISIHFVDEEYDHGNIIFQEKVNLEEGETPESLAEKIHLLEHSHLPKVVDEVLSKLPG